MNERQTWKILEAKIDHAAYSSGHFEAVSEQLDHRVTQPAITRHMSRVA